MGGQKGPEKNRNYEKNRRDRFNNQVTELNTLLPDFDPSIIKVTKCEIIGRAIQFLKDTRSKNQKLENEFENEKNKISELQKKVAGLLQIIKELIKLLHKSNINFPSSLPVDDIVSFKKAYVKCKRKSKESSMSESKRKKITIDGADLLDLSEEESSDTETETARRSVEKSPSSITATRSGNQSPPISAAPVPISSIQSAHSPQVINLDTPVLRVNSNSLILPQGNFVAVNGLQNTVLNNVNNSSTILLNKPVTVPTLILMQNNFVPVCTAPPVTVSQRSQKLIVPKMTINSTKTTFINKKPIPAVRLFKSSITGKDGAHKLPKRKLSRRSKGILVKYPKRKPATKRKKREAAKKLDEKSEVQNANVADKAENVDSFTSLQPCNVENSFSNEDAIKSYPDHLFDSQDIQATGQFIDFFESNSRSIDTADGNVGSEFETSGLNAEKAKQIEYGENAFAGTSLNCGLMESVTKAPVKDRESVGDAEKSLYLPSSSNGNPPLLEYVSSSNETVPIVAADSRDENAMLDKRKPDKELAPLTIQCNLENKSLPKELNLSFDDKKHYESSFDEFSSDLFTSLQVPSSGQNADSISPTAAFLLTFPVVSSCKNADLLPEHEDDSNAAAVAASSTTILQIGNLESPSTLLFTHKQREGKDSDKADEGFTYCGAELEKKKDGKETPRDVFNFDVFATQPAAKSACSKEPQNVTSFYPSSSSSTFPSYSIFTKYNDIPAVTSSYYSLGTQPFAKSTDPVGEFNSWPSAAVYAPEEGGKEKSKRDKCTSGVRNTFGLPANEPADKAKASKSKPKQSNARPLVNWMTSPDLRNAAPDTQSLSDVFAMPKDDAVNTFLNSPNVQNTTNFSYPSADYYLENQSYVEPPLSSCKIAYSSATNPTNYSWSPAKTSLPALPLERNMMIPSTLPTLVGDLALGNNSSFNNYDLISKKYDTEKKKEVTCKSYYKTQPQNAGSGSFLSVTQLVDDKAQKPPALAAKKDGCHFEEVRDKCYKENFGLGKNEEYKKGYQAACKDAKSTKCKKDSAKYNASRCAVKENKKDNNGRQQQKFNEYSSSSCQLANKEVNPLSNKNSNYSAESLISSSNHANVCSSQNYFAYDNSANYNSCAKRTDEADSLANVGYYTNTNYVYHNNFQTFNNYGFSNQCYNNYSSQVQPGGFQKKKDEGQLAKQDTDWYKESFSSYNTVVPSEFAGNQKEKCKQTFANRYNHGQKNAIGSSVYNNYYQYSSSASAVLNHTKSSCNFGSTYSFNQAGQQCSNTGCQTTPGSSGRNLAANTNPSVHAATTLTNFNLSTIFPEINDKHCVPNRANAVANEKNDPKYGVPHKAGNMDEMNYNYVLQSTAIENNAESASVYGSSGFQISPFTDFSSKKCHK